MTLLNYYKSLILLFIIVGFLGLGTVMAQENSEEMVKKYNIKFPVAELGNCTSYVACKEFCNLEANRDACTAFAKKKGFHNEADNQKNTTLLKEAQKELGCSAEVSCREICEKEENFEKCKAFAQKHRLGDPQEHPGNKQILEKAKTILGCDSKDSCKVVCENPDNQQKCSEFAKQTGLGGGIKRVGPGGCNSEETCRAYCENNQEECRKFGGNNHQSPPETEKRGPGGCDSEESCKTYCESHPNECGGFGSNRREPEDREKTEQFCKDNPGKCLPSNKTPENRNEFCKNNPDKCRSFDETNRQMENSSQQNFRPEDDRQREDERSEFQKSPQTETSAEKNGEVKDDLQKINQEVQQTEDQQIKGISTEKSWWEQLVSFFLP